MISFSQISFAIDILKTKFLTLQSKASQAEKQYYEDKYQISKY